MIFSLLLWNFCLVSNKDWQNPWVYGKKSHKKEWFDDDDDDDNNNNKFSYKFDKSWMDQSLLNESYADIVLFCTNRMDNVLSSKASNRLVRQ